MIMTRMQPTTLFLDIGGIMLTNGWDRNSRKRAEKVFGLEDEHEEIAVRHESFFDVYELGKLSLDGYIERVFFYRNRPFTPEDFKAFMFEQSQPMVDMLEFLRQLKAKHNLRTIAVSNEGRELAVYRVKKYHLGDFIDSFIVSSFVHLRKPDPQIYTLALDMAQVPAGEVVYLEDRILSIEAAQQLGIPSILHTDCESTREALARMGLSLATGGGKPAAAKGAAAARKRGRGHAATGKRVD
jgi:putative hydrolase of the HAD superfamily